MGSFDAVVAGAGPAGAVAAALLAREGRRVALIDAPALGRHKIGESLPQAAAQLLRRLDLPAPREGGPHVRIAGTHSLWGGEEVINDALNDPGGGGWRLDRMRFDRDLCEAAVAAGAELVEGKVTDVEAVGTGWRVGSGTGRPLDSALVIDATGRSAILARRLGARQIPDEPLVAVWALGERQDGEQANRTYVESGAEGWWYAAMLPGGVPLAAFHCRPEFATQLAGEPGQWRALLRRSRLIARAIAVSSFDAARLHRADARGLTLEPACGAGWFAVGDAALSFDPMASQGIFNAISSAAMAVRAVTGEEPLAGQMGYLARLARIRSTYRDRLRDLALRSGSEGPYAAAS